MIRDLSASLNAILTQPGLSAGFPELAAAQISFDQPAEPYAPTTATINLFLYDIRENTELRLNEPAIARLNGSASVTQPPRRILCTYLATAWVPSGTDMALQEHRLLTQVLTVLSQYPIMPANFAQGTIKTNDPPVPIQVALGTSEAGIPEFWSALGAKLRPSLTVQATIALPIFAPQTGPLAITSRVDLSPIQPGGQTASTETVYHLTGRVTAASGLPVPNATVKLVEANLQTLTDAGGVYWFGPLLKGQYTLTASAGAASQQIQRQVPTPQNTNYNIQFTS